jgi:hypothetical protein
MGAHFILPFGNNAKGGVYCLRARDPVASAAPWSSDASVSGPDKRNALRRIGHRISCAIHRIRRNGDNRLILMRTFLCPEAMLAVDD